MKLGEKGYTLIELIIAITIMTLAAGAAGAAIFQILRNIERNSDYMTVVRQVENAGYWISRDAQMARVVTTTDNLTLPVFLSLSWTEWNAAGNPIYHSANYSFEGLTNSVGKLKRTHASGGISEQTLIAQYIYYNSDDATNTSNTSYESPVLTVKLTAVFEGIQETREYKIKRRPDL
jgi:prepilin-type N-terminal cleavage/methylation domain-containing protein